MSSQFISEMTIMCNFKVVAQNRQFKKAITGGGVPFINAREKQNSLSVEGGHGANRHQALQVIAP